MLRQFLQYSKVNQLNIYIYPFFHGLFSHLGHHGLSSLALDDSEVLTVWLRVGWGGVSS